MSFDIRVLTDFKIEQKLSEQIEETNKDDKTKKKELGTSIQ